MNIFFRWGSCPLSFWGLSSCHIVWNNSSSTHANTGFLQGTMTKNQITNIFKIDWFLFCLDGCRILLTSFLTFYWTILKSVKCIMCIFAQASSVPCHFHNMPSEHQHMWQVPVYQASEQNMEILRSIPPVCPLNVVTRVQFSCSSLRMVTWPEWSPINTCRVSTSNLSCKH